MVDVNLLCDQVKQLTPWLYLVYVHVLSFPKYGTNSLVLAAIRGHTETVGLLLDYGADMEAIHQVK